MALTKNVTASIAMSLGSRPKTNGKSKAIDASTTTGTVRPIHASAEPTARFMLLCSRSARAARTAAHVSGSNVHGQPGEIVDNVTQANVIAGVKKLNNLEPILAPRVKAESVKVVGGIYDLETGIVKLVQPESK